MSHGPILSHFGVPHASRPSMIGMVKDKNRKMTVQETTMVYAEVPAMETSEVPHTNSTESAAAVQIAATGVRNCGLTFESAVEPGRPRSRANAKIMRGAEVTVASPQRS